MEELKVTEQEYKAKIELGKRILKLASKEAQEVEKEFGVEFTNDTFVWALDTAIQKFAFTEGLRANG